MTYNDYLETKRVIIPDSGFEIRNDELNSALFDYQRDLDKWSLKRGRSALFTMTGTGKTMMQTEWAQRVHEKTNGNILIVAPLAVSAQTIRDSKDKLGISINYAKTQDDVKKGLTITNYERLGAFNAQKFEGIVLDESSILKSFNGKIRTEIIGMFQQTPYKLSCTATPSPNDFMELGNQAEFLNIMNRNEMLAMFFVHDGGDTSKWRLKGHAEGKFWQWVASWAAVLTKPSDLGYDDSRFILPEKRNFEHIVKSNYRNEGSLFGEDAKTLQERQAARRESISERAKLTAELATANNDSFLCWCDLNSESEELQRMIPGSKQIKGSDSPEYKEKTMLQFSDGSLRCLITKPSIAGFGMNWQHCHQMAFTGLSDSFEQYFQAVRRCYRFGQKKSVDVHIVISEREGEVTKNIARKEANAERMMSEIVNHTRKFVMENIQSNIQKKTNYNPRKEMILPEFLTRVAQWSM